MLEIIITVIGIVQGILAMLNKRINWLVYALQMILLVVFSWYAKLYGDTIQNSVYFFFCLAGYYSWKADNPADKIITCSWISRIWWLFICIVVWIAGGKALSITDDPLPYVDSFTTVTTIIALILMVEHRLETWIVWFFNDIAYMYQYFSLPDQALYLFGLYVVWTVMAVASFINWYRIYEKDYDPIADAYSRHCGHAGTE